MLKYFAILSRKKPSFGSREKNDDTTVCADDDDAHGLTATTAISYLPFSSFSLARNVLGVFTIFHGITELLAGEGVLSLLFLFEAWIYRIFRYQFRFDIDLPEFDKIRNNSSLLPPAASSLRPAAPLGHRDSRNSRKSCHRGTFRGFVSACSMLRDLLPREGEEARVGLHGK